MYSVETLYRPVTLDEALGILRQDCRAVPLAGGTDVLVRMRAKRQKNLHLLSLSLLQELRGISADDAGNITIGAAMTFTEIAEHPLIQAKLPLLETASRAMGGPQTQNVATIGGNICNGATSADAAPVLLALDAVLRLERADGSRTVAARDFFVGPGAVVRQHEEILTDILLPIGSLQKWGGCYIKMSPRGAMDISLLGCAALCELDGNNCIKDARIALGTAAPTPMRCPDAEARLEGQELTRELLADVGKKVAAECKPRTSWRASEEYRRCLADELSVRAFSEAFLAAGGVLR